MSNIGQQVGNPADIRKFSASKELVDDTTYIGVEIEVEGLNKHPRLSDYWERKADGSLREGGAEFTFSFPLRAVDIENALKELYGWFGTNKHIFSERCGLHIHLDVRDMDVQQLSSLMVHCLMYERAMFALAGNKRDDNIFCMPLYKADRALIGWHKGLASDKVEYILQNTDKYYGVNLRAIGKYGSVEFRMPAATESYNQVISWINLVLSLKKSALKFSGKLDGLLGAVSADNSNKFAEQVFPKGHEILKHINKHDVLDGIRIAQSWVYFNSISEAASFMPKKLHTKSLVHTFLSKNNIKIPEDKVAKIDDTEVRTRGTQEPRIHVRDMFSGEMLAISAVEFTPDRLRQLHNNRTIEIAVGTMHPVAEVVWNGDMWVAPRHRAVNVGIENLGVVLGNVVINHANQPDQEVE